MTDEYEESIDILTDDPQCYPHYLPRDIQNIIRDMYPRICTFDRVLRILNGIIESLRINDHADPTYFYYETLMENMDLFQYASERADHPLEWWVRANHYAPNDLDSTLRKICVANHGEEFWEQLSEYRCSARFGTILRRASNTPARS